MTKRKRETINHYYIRAWNNEGDRSKREEWWIHKKIKEDEVSINYQVSDPENAMEEGFYADVTEFASSIISTQQRALAHETNNTSIHSG